MPTRARSIRRETSDSFVTRFELFVTQVIRIEKIHDSLFVVFQVLINSLNKVLIPENPEIKESLDSRNPHDRVPIGTEDRNLSIPDDREISHTHY